MNTALMSGIAFAGDSAGGQLSGQLALLITNPAYAEHGFGEGRGTDAEGWYNDADAFIASLL